MRELTRSNDPVFLSYLRAELSAEGIEALMLDAFASSVLEPMNMTALQRVMVADEDYWPAWAINEEAEERATEDQILGGRAILLQPVTGFRAAIDPILLAASVPVETGDQVLDVGTGSGAAVIALLARLKNISVTGMDVQPGLIAMGARSAVRNDFKLPPRFIGVDIAHPSPTVDAMMFDHVMSNPPFLPVDRGQRPKDLARALATIESSADLKTWIQFMDDHLRDRGTLSVIHRADRVPEILDALGGGYGDLKILECVPVDDGRPVKRAIVQAVKGASTTEVIRGSLILHNVDGSFTDAAQAILRDAHHLTI